MRTLYTALSILLISAAAYAQPTSDTFPDFTFDDLDGETHHLQSYLDQGKTVVIDVFATWCGPCQNSVPGIESLYNTLGQAGDESLVVLSFERDPNTTNEAQFIENYNKTSPVITTATDLILDTWNVTYQPRYFVICADGSFSAEHQSPINSNPQPLINLAEECSVASGLDADELAAGFKILGSVDSDGIRFQSSFDQVEYQLIDITGNLLQSGQLGSGEGIIDMGARSNGIYLLRISNGSALFTQRFVKQS